MHKIKLLLSLFGCSILNFTVAQDLVIVDNGQINGKFSEKIGAKDGFSISTSNEKDFLNIKLSGEESWAGAYLIPNSLGETATMDLSGYKYFVFKIRSNDVPVIEKIGFGKGGEISEIMRNFVVSSSWKKIVMELPPGMTKQRALFSLITVKKASFDIAEVRYTNNLPKADENTTFLMSSPYNKLSNTAANYVYSEGFETGAPSGYSGEKNGLSMAIDDKCMESPFMGRYCIKINVDDKESWRALFVQVSGKWTTELNKNTKLPDLSAYKKLVFYAKSTTKDYLLPEVGFGGKSNVFSQEQRNIVFLEISNKWKRFEIDLRGLEKKSVNDVMILVLREGTLFLDEIRFEK